MPCIFARRSPKEMSCSCTSTVAARPASGICQGVVRQDWPSTTYSFRIVSCCVSPLTILRDQTSKNISPSTIVFVVAGWKLSRRFTKGMGDLVHRQPWPRQQAAMGEINLPLGDPAIPAGGREVDGPVAQPLGTHDLPREVKSDHFSFSRQDGCERLNIDRPSKSGG